MENEVFSMLLRAQNKDGDIVATFVGNGNTSVELFKSQNLDPRSPTYLPIKRIKTKGYNVEDNNTVIFNDANDHIVNYYLEDELHYVLFMDNLRIKRIKLPTYITTLYINCFYNSLLESINLENITYYYRSCFGNSKLSGDIIINQGTMEGGIFAGTKITSLTINTNIQSLSHDQTNGAGFCARCSNLETVTIPNSVLSLGNYCFDNCIKLTTINKPTSLTTIGVRCFCNTKITSFDLNGVITIGNSAFENSIISGILRIPNTVTSLGTSVFKSCSKITNAIIECNITAIPDATFNGASNLETVVLPNSVVTLSANSFHNCQKLREININNVTTLGYMCFYRNTALNNNNLNLTDNIISLGDRCLEDTNYIFYKLPSSLTYLGVRTPARASGDHVIPDGVTAINGGSYNSTNITSIDCGRNVTIIGNKPYMNDNSAFRGCYNLTKIIIHDKVTDINGASFGNLNNPIIILYPTTPPNINTIAFIDNNTGNCCIDTFYVPDNYVNDYKVAANWSRFSDKIKPISDYQP